MSSYKISTRDRILLAARALLETDGGRFMSLRTEPVLSPRFDPLSRHALFLMMWFMLV
jgi:hypothetical protein